MLSERVECEAFNAPATQWTIRFKDEFELRWGEHFCGQSSIIYIAAQNPLWQVLSQITSILFLAKYQLLDRNDDGTSYIYYLGRS